MAAARYRPTKYAVACGRSPFEALLLGGIAFLLVVARPAGATAPVESFCFRGIGWAALALTVYELVE